MQDQIGDERLLERRGETLDELRRQPADEADRVGDEVPAPLVDEEARGRVERFEETVVDGHVRIREDVQERRLADIRVPGERDRRRFCAASFLPPHVALFSQFGEAPAQDRDAAPSDPPVGLELRLAGPARPDPAAEALEVLPEAPHPRQVVLELRELHLQLAVGGSRVLGEDVQDQLRAVHDPRLERVLECPLLHGVELAVDEQHLGVRVLVSPLEVLQLALAEVGAALGAVAVLNHLCDRVDECCTRQLSQLRKLIHGIYSLSQYGDDEPALQRGVRLAGRHGLIMPATRHNPQMPAERLARRTLELVDIPSESRSEQAIAAYVADAVTLPALHADDEVLFYGERRPKRPFVVLAGHLDTIPAQENIPGRLEDGVVHGLGASDMKGGLAVMIELARTLSDTELDVAYLFFVREELPAGESALPRFFAASADIHDAELVVMLEPTDNAIHAGCLGNLNARVRFDGLSAHSARPWLGENAIHRAIEGLAEVARLEPLDVEVDGLVFREVISVVRVEGGIAQNVVPDRAVAELNYRYAPGRTPESAERRLREVVPGATFEQLADSPPAHVAVESALAHRLREAGSFAVEPKQAWTPVAEFAGQGLDALNLGPGATRFAHKRDEQVEVAELVRTYEALARFLRGSV